MENNPKFLNIIDFYDINIDYIRSLGFYTLPYLVKAGYIMRRCSRTSSGKICEYLPNRSKLEEDVHYIEKDGIYYYNVDFLIDVLEKQKEYRRENGGG